MPYQFTVEDFNKFTQDIVDSKGDQAVMSTLLADMQATMMEAVGANLKLSADYDTIKAENDRLKNANMDLMYRLGQKAVDETAKKEEGDKPLERGKNIDAYLEDVLDEK